MAKEITVPEAARQAGVSVAWIRRLCAEGRIEGARKLGRDWILPDPPRLRTTTTTTEMLAPRAKR